MRGESRNPRKSPRLRNDAAPGLVATDAADGFPQPALHASAPLLRDKARHQGIATVAIRDSHHFAALWPDIEPFADQGFIALAMGQRRQGVSVWGGTRKVLGNMSRRAPRRRFVSRTRAGERHRVGANPGSRRPRCPAAAPCREAITTGTARPSTQPLFSVAT